MRLINDVVFAILIAHLWGSAMLAVWQYTAKKLEGKGYTRLLFCLLRSVIAAYLLPLSTVIVKAVIRFINYLNGTELMETPAVLTLGAVIFWIWVIGMCWNLEDIWEEWKLTQRWLDDALPAAEEHQKRFQDVCKRLGQDPGKVKLYEKAGLGCGITTGMFYPIIVLPKGKMELFEEEVTLIHELIHYRRRDLWFLVAAKVVETIHWFNPWVRGLSVLMNQWNEYACDWEVCKYVGDVRAYAEVLLETSIKAQSNKSGLFSSIGTEPMKLNRRIKRMADMKKANKRSKVFTILAAAAMTVSCAGSALASTGVMTEGYRALCNLTEVENDVEGISLVGETSPLQVYDFPDNSDINPEDYVNTGIWFRDVLPVDDYTVVEMEDTSAVARTSGTFTWTIPYNCMANTHDFWVSKTKKVTVSGDLSPMDAVMRVGIKDSLGIRYCIYATGSFAYNFPVEFSGLYDIYAINDNLYDVSINGGYHVY